MEPKSYRYIITGDPIPLARARHTAWAVYDSQKHIKLCWGINLRNLHGDQPLLTGKPLQCDLIFYMSIPKSWSAKKQNAMEGQRHIYKPDGSNLLKFVEDVCKGIIYTDDCLIAKISVDKFYSHIPRTELTITELL